MEIKSNIISLSLHHQTDVPNPRAVKGSSISQSPDTVRCRARRMPETETERAAHGRLRVAVKRRQAAVIRRLSGPAPLAVTARLDGLGKVARRTDGQTGPRRRRSTSRSVALGPVGRCCVGVTQARIDHRLPESVSVAYPRPVPHRAGVGSVDVSVTLAPHCTVTTAATPFPRSKRPTCSETGRRGYTTCCHLMIVPFSPL
jgi:hypothetical protein